MLNYRKSLTELNFDFGLKDREMVEVNRDE